MGITGFGIVFSFSLVLILALGVILPAYATSDETNPVQDYDWNVIVAEDILNDPTAIKILQNIEISKQRIAQLQDPKIIMSEHQKFIEVQRQISQAKLQEQLDRMYKDNEEFTPKAAFAKYVAKKPAHLHDFYWSLFNYLEQKVIKARDARDAILENGGSYQEAQQVFIEYAKMPKAERIQYFNDMVLKYGHTNVISNLVDFNALPIETKNAFATYMSKKQLGPPSVAIPLDVAPNDVTESVNLVTFSSSFVIDDAQDKILDTVTHVENVSLPPSDTSMNFNGQKYATKTVADMDTISEFTLSTWVNPDYSQGSSEFTILSKENAFSLTINNNKWPQKIAKFSIFDGIKWTMVESVSTIEEEWTHVAASLDGSSISIYINGNLEATKQIDGVPYMNSYGFVQVQPLENISSESEVLIGAQLSTKRGDQKTMGFFSGSVDEVVIEDELLGNQQIIELCHQSKYYLA